jgi:hypothetical protein
MPKSLLYTTSLIFILMAAGDLSAQTIPQLRCGDNVRCNDKGDVLDAMVEAYDYMNRSNDRVVITYQRLCADAFDRVASLHPNIPFNAGIAQPQLDVCNAGLYEMHR